jgi:hypothetical protein
MFIKYFKNLNAMLYSLALKLQIDQHDSTSSRGIDLNKKHENKPEYAAVERNFQISRVRELGFNYRTSKG